MAGEYLFYVRWFLLYLLLLGIFTKIIRWKEMASSGNKQNLEASNLSNKVINAVGLSKVVDYLVKEKKWTKSEAILGCNQYKNYLLLLKKYPNPETIPPSLDIGMEKRLKNRQK